MKKIAIYKIIEYIKRNDKLSILHKEDTEEPLKTSLHSYTLLKKDGGFLRSSASTRGLIQEKITSMIPNSLFMQSYSQKNALISWLNDFN